MSKHASHTFVLGSRVKAGKLPVNEFGFLVGQFDHSTLVPEGGRKPDSHHVYLWVRVASGAVAGTYESAFNIHSEQGAASAAEVLFTERIENLAATAIPVPGFTPASLSFSELGLLDDDFAAVVQGKLQILVTNLAQTCNLMGVYGTTYSDGTGIHDIHMNSGTGTSSDRVDQDGAIVFYFSGASQTPPQPYAHWVFVKFNNQHIP